MTDDLITKAFKNAKESLIPASEIVAILKDLQDQSRIFNKRYAGSMGGDDMRRLKDVQFQTYPRYYEWPDQMRVMNLITPTAIPFLTITPIGKIRIAAVSLALISGADPPAGGAIITIEAEAPVACGSTTIAVLRVSPTHPFTSFVMPEPFPSSGQMLTFPINPSFGIEHSPLYVRLNVYNPADQAQAFIYYTDHIDNP